MGNVYLSGIEAIHNGDSDYLTDTVRVGLLVDDTVASFDETHDFVAGGSGILDDAGNTEMTDATYQAVGATGRVDLAGPKEAQIAGALVELNAGKSIWDPLDGEIVSAAFVYFFITSDALSPALSFHDFTDKAANGSAFEVRWNSIDGIGRVLSLANAP